MTSKIKEMLVRFIFFFFFFGWEEKEVQIQ